MKVTSKALVKVLPIDTLSSTRINANPLFEILHTQLSLRFDKRARLGLVSFIMGYSSQTLLSLDLDYNPLRTVKIKLRRGK